jgi:hypothetical protein
VPANGEPSLSAEAIQDVYRFPYPAPVAVVLAPLGALPFEVAASLLTVASIVAMLLSLRLLGVADPRCYGLAFLWVTTLGAIRLGTLTPLLLLGIAVAWRFRDRTGIAAGALAAVVVAKLFLWPLLFWPLFTRRPRLTLWAVVTAAAAMLAGWAVLGFAGLRDYPDLLSSLSASVQGQGWSLVALGLGLGLSTGVAKAVAVAVGVGLVAAAWRAGRDPLGDGRALSLALLAAIALSPIVWLHYFVLLAIPIALARPYLAGLWFAPLAFWAWPFQETEERIWPILVAAATCAAVMLGRTNLRARHSRADRSAPATLHA